ncbi:hypothetical protein [Pandoraea sputorum]|uniref:hypothetical protein n=1 Tax=Pandoraea sputorum TaxID=93222 RepID=UPI0012F50C59|nr:hypothetical protein [Pandoraea sputorum]
MTNSIPMLFGLEIVELEMVAEALRTLIAGGGVVPTGEAAGGAVEMTVAPSMMS